MTGQHSTKRRKLPPKDEAGTSRNCGPSPPPTHVAGMSLDAHMTQPMASAVAARSGRYLAEFVRDPGIEVQVHELDDRPPEADIRMLPLQDLVTILRELDSISRTRVQLVCKAWSTLLRENIIFQRMIAVDYALLPRAPRPDSFHTYTHYQKAFSEYQCSLRRILCPVITSKMSHLDISDHSNPRQAWQRDSQVHDISYDYKVQDCFLDLRGSLIASKMPVEPIELTFGRLVLSINDLNWDVLRSRGLLKSATIRLAKVVYISLYNDTDGLTSRDLDYFGLVRWVERFEFDVRREAEGFDMQLMRRFAENETEPLSKREITSLGRISLTYGNRCRRFFEERLRKWNLLDTPQVDWSALIDGKGLDLFAARLLIATEMGRSTDESDSEDEAEPALMALPLEDAAPSH